MRLVYSALSWLLGLLLILAGAGTSLERWHLGIPYFLAGVFLLPPVRSAAFRLTRLSLPTVVRAIVVVALFWAGSALQVQEHERQQQIAEAKKARQQAELDERLRDTLTRNFAADREQIIADATRALDGNDFQEVVSEYSRYLFLDDPDLAAIMATAKAGLAAQKAEAEAAERQRQRAATAAQDRRSRISTQFDVWDGSHLALTRLIKESMNDPNSYEHVETVYWDVKDHLVVRTKFRGKNAFGAVVTQTIKARVELGGPVIEVIEIF